MASVSLQALSWLCSIFPAFYRQMLAIFCVPKRGQYVYLLRETWYLTSVNFAYVRNNTENVRDILGDKLRQVYKETNGRSFKMIVGLTSLIITEYAIVQFNFFHANYFSETILLAKELLRTTQSYPKSFRTLNLLAKTF